MELCLSGYEESGFLFFHLVYCHIQEKRIMNTQPMYSMFVHCHQSNFFNINVTEAGVSATAGSHSGLCSKCELRVEALGGGAGGVALGCTASGGCLTGGLHHALISSFLLKNVCLI